MANKTVEGYIEGLEEWQKEIISRVRAIVLKAAPEAKESIKWAQPVYESNGPFSYIQAFKNTVNFGFWRGADLIDPKKLLSGKGVKMAHVKLTSLKDIDEQALTDFVRQAVELNIKKGDPTKGS